LYSSCGKAPGTLGHYRPDIDGLRAFAVLAVVAYHASPFRVKGGFIGVDVFFVISGYLISGVILDDLHKGAFSLWNFYSRRIRRIFPALIIVLALALVFGWFVLFPDEYLALGRHTAGGAAFFTNFILWREAGYFDVAAKAKPLLHLWSLGIEEQFYLVFPLLLWGCAQKRLRLITVVVFLGLLSFLGNLYSMDDPAANYYNPLVRLWELLVGAALCLFTRRPAANGLYLQLDAWAAKAIYDKEQENDGRSLSLALALLGVLLLAVALVLARDFRPYPGWQAILPVLGAMLLIAAGPRNPISHKFLANRIAVFIGLVSYPLYLWHWALISYAFIIHGDFLGSGTRFLRLGLVVASFILAVLTYFLVERPIRFGAWARTGKVHALIFTMLMVGVAGRVVRLREGLPEREHFKKLSAIAEQLAPYQRGDYSKNEEGFSYAGVEKDQLGYCKYEDVGAGETVALIGDSHAASASWGLAKLGRELGYNTVLLGWIVPAGEIWSEENSKNIPVVLEVLKRNNDIKKVFICTRGILYMTGIHNYPAGEVVEPRRVPGYAAFKKSLQSYVDTLREYGKEVFIISENPELPDSPRDYLPRPFVPAKEFPVVPKVEVMERQGAYLKLLSEISGATIIDTIGPFCPGGECLVFTTDGLPLYYDDDHLSPAGSEFQAEHILRPHLK
jgi:peptidoglycan/LPS O-acetylase OafA/YrhL